MILRTILFFLLMYLLIKVISRLFLPSKDNKKSRKGPSFFYRMYQQQQNQSKQNSQSGNSSQQRFEQIEEAEFEDITEDEKPTSKSSD